MPCINYIIWKYLQCVQRTAANQTYMNQGKLLRRIQEKRGRKLDRKHGKKSRENGGSKVNLGPLFKLIPLLLTDLFSE